MRPLSKGNINMDFLFIHGGPGLNSNPEENILKDSFLAKGHNIYFWNEPSPMRGHLSEVITYEDSCYSLESQIHTLAVNEKITVIAHSFGAFLLNDILPHVEKDLARIILVSPVTNITSLDLNLITEGMKATSNIADKEFLEKYLESMRPDDFYDSKRFEALKLATKDNIILGQYWNKKEFIPAYYNYFSDFKFQFNIDSFNSIRKTCPKITITEKSLVTTSIIYGSHDPFISSKDQSLIQKFYNNSEVFLLEDSSHYGHIEESGEFLDRHVLDERKL